MEIYKPGGVPSTGEVGCCDSLVTLFPNVFKGKPKDCRLEDLLRDIKSGFYANPIALIREKFRIVLDQTSDTQKAKHAIAGPKKELPAFCISGTATDRKTPVAHSGFLQIDLDGLGAPLSVVREKMMRDQHVAFGFISPSGDGLKLGLRIDGKRHAESFDAAKAYLSDAYGLQIDPSCKDRLRLCFVSYDPDLWTNWGATELPTPHPTPDICLNPVSAPASTSSILHPASCITPTRALALIKQRGEAMALLEAKHPGLSQLYELLVESQFDAVAGGRNDFIVQSVPFLYRAVCPQFVLELVGCFYGCHHALFNDPREQHMNEAKAMLNSVINKYAGSLPPDEKQVYTALDEREQNVFRICRDLALLPEPKREPLTFYLSFNHLALRLGVFPKQAQRSLLQLERYGLIKLLKKGTRRAPGVRGEAGTYRWQLTTPKPGEVSP